MRKFFILLAGLLSALPNGAKALEVTAHRIVAEAVAPETALNWMTLRVRDGVVRVIADRGNFKAIRTPVMEKHDMPEGVLPDSGFTIGTRNIRNAWLTLPTRCYRHGALGDSIEAGGLSATLGLGRKSDLVLDQNSVFEDRIPRLADMDGDGTDEILVVRSFLDAGAALTLITAKGGRLAIAASAEPIGMANRWLNPVGAADFDGGGRMEAAVVITPHIGGTLQLYEWKGDKLVGDHSAYGFSNHSIGSRELGLSTITDLNADGITDMIVPDAGRGYLIGLTFAGGAYKELFRHQMEGRLATNVVAGDLDGDGRPEIAYGTGDGKGSILTVRP